MELGATALQNRKREVSGVASCPNMANIANIFVMFDVFTVTNKRTHEHPPIGCSCVRCSVRRVRVQMGAIRRPNPQSVLAHCPLSRSTVGAPWFSRSDRGLSTIVAQLTTIAVAANRWRPLLLAGRGLRRVRHE